jgi:homoserine kinase type II
MFDLGIVINAWCSRPDGSLDRLRMRDLLQAYSQVRPLSEHENLAIPMVLRWTALRFWLSRLHDQFMVDQQDDVQHKDAVEFKQILLSRRQRLSGMQR